MTSVFDAGPVTDRTGRLVAVTTDDGRDGSVVRLAGDLDLASAALIAVVVGRALAQGRRRVSFDVAALDFLDCTGLRALVDARGAALTAGGSFVLTGVGPRIAWLLDLTGLDALFADGTRTSLDVH